MKTSVHFLCMAAVLACLAFPVGSGAQTIAVAKGTDECRLPASRALSRGETYAESLAVDTPRFLPPKEAVAMDDEEIFGVHLKGFTAAFPLRFLVWHEAVNFLAGGEKRSLTYCPYAGSAIGYTGFTLAVSGLVADSNLILTDRETKSRLIQMDGGFFDGPLRGRTPETFPVTHTTWGRWRQAHPESSLLAAPDGGVWDYDCSPFENYRESDALFFPVSTHGGGLSPKERVLVLTAGGQRTALLVTGFGKRHPKGLDFTLGGRPVRVTVNENMGSLDYEGASGFEAYWFAFHARWPDIRPLR